MQARRSHKKSSRIPCNSWFDWRWSRHHTCSGDDHSRRPVAAVVQELLKGMVAVCYGENNLACRREVSHYNNISSKLVHLHNDNWSRWYTVQYCSMQTTLIYLNMIYMDLYGFIWIYIILLFLFLGFVCLCKSSIDRLIGGGPVTTPAAETSTQGHCRQRNAFVRFRKDHVGKCVCVFSGCICLVTVARPKSKYVPPPSGQESTHSSCSFQVRFGTIRHFCSTKKVSKET